jgi:hypothetical protein
MSIYCTDFSVQMRLGIVTTEAGLVMLSETLGRVSLWARRCFAAQILRCAQDDMIEFACEN